MTIHVPEWLLWTLGLSIGIPLVLFILAAAVFGVMVANALKGGIWR